MRNNEEYEKILRAIQKTTESPPANQQTNPTDQTEQNLKALKDKLKSLKQQVDQEQPIEQQAGIEKNHEHDIKLNNINQLLEQKEPQQNNQQPLAGTIPPQQDAAAQVIDIAQKIRELEQKPTSIGNIALLALLNKLNTGENTQITTTMYQETERRAQDLDFNNADNLENSGSALMLKQLPSALEKINDYIITQYIKMKYLEDQQLSEENTTDILNAVIAIDGKIIEKIQATLKGQDKESKSLDSLKEFIEKFKGFNETRNQVNNFIQQIQQSSNNPEKQELRDKKTPLEKQLESEYQKQSEYEQTLRKMIQKKWSYLKKQNQQPSIKTTPQKNNKGPTFEKLEKLKKELQQKYDAVAQKTDNQTIKQAIKESKEQVGLKKDGKHKGNVTLEIESRHFKENPFLETLIENMPESKVIQIAQDRDFSTLSDTIKNTVIEKIQDIQKARTQIPSDDLFQPIKEIPQYNGFDFDGFLQKHQAQKTYEHDPNAPGANGNNPLKGAIHAFDYSQLSTPVAPHQDNNANASQPKAQVAAADNQDEIPAPPPPPPTTKTSQPAAENKTNTKGPQPDLMQEIQQFKLKQNSDIQTAKEILQGLGVEDIVDKNAIIEYAKNSGVDIKNGNALNELYSQIKGKQKELRATSQPSSVKDAISISALKNPNNVQTTNQPTSVFQNLLANPRVRSMLDRANNSDTEKDSDDDTWDEEEDKRYAQTSKTRAMERQQHHNQTLTISQNQAIAPKAKPPLENLFNELPQEINTILSRSSRVDELTEDKYQNAAGYLSLFKDSNVNLDIRKQLAEQLSTVLGAEKVQKTTAQNRLNELLQERNIDIATYQQKYQTEQEDARSKMEPATQNQEETPEPQADNTPDQPTAPTKDDHQAHLTQTNLQEQSFLQKIRERREGMKLEPTDDDSDSEYDSDSDSEYDSDSDFD